ncbi:MAG: precorrin-2 C(20)-methyltransferase [Gammaproteobacteria bacterium]|nr:precorrin-2 C(20)-methyltransferase [Gammaproteobacteria bacterium]
MTGCFYGVGVGPGDPELLTLKAVRLIQNADLLCYLSNEAGHSQAKEIARFALDETKRSQQRLPIVIPMSRQRDAANAVYDAASALIAKALDAAQSVVFLCEGDPLFFGSFNYLLERLQGRYRCQVVAGISSLHAAAAALQRPLTQQEQSLVVVSGRHSDAELLQALATHDSVVILKAGQARSRILALLKRSGRFDQGLYLEQIGRPEQRIVGDLAELENKAGPYFSLFVVLKK